MLNPNRRVSIFLALLALSSSLFPIAIGEKAIIYRDLEVMRVSQHGYIHVSYMTAPEWGRFPSNGLIYVIDDECFVVDTPWNREMSKLLIEWIETALKAKIKGIAVGHWHDDCLGGLAEFHARNITSYSHQLTQTEARNRRLPIPQTGFKDEIPLRIGGCDVILHYPGCGHTRDNIVVWFPEDKLLFGGCLVKEKRSQSPGNTADAVMEDWPQSVLNVKKRFPEAVIVVPGHGQPGGPSLLDHTVELVQKKL